jgi:hypothetical protein
MERIQSLLLRGERREAVEVAISCREFATALLVASMCDAETYKRAAQEYAEKAFVAESPMHTVAMLFSGSLQAPPASASRTQSDHWGVDPVELKMTWKQHLAAIISNRTVGWDRIVLSLGDRLNEIGDFRGAHFCYMICGCPISNPITQGTRIALLGCDHNERLNLALMTDEAVIAYERTEAYEWAKRRGNKNAAIQSFQPFKLIYAMLLADFGLGDNARLVAQSIRQCIDIPPAKIKKSTRSTMSQLFEDRETLAYALSELEFRLECRKNPAYVYEGESSGGARRDADSIPSGQEPPRRDKEPSVSGSDDARKAESSIAKQTDSHPTSSKVSESKIGNTNGNRTKSGLGMQVPNKSIKKQSEQKSVLLNRSLDGENEVRVPSNEGEGGLDESFMTAKSNLMEKNGYNNDRPRMAPMPSSRATEKTRNEPRQVASAQQAPPMFNNAFPGMPQQQAQTPEQVPTKQPPPAMTTPQETKKPKTPPRTAPAVMTGKKSPGKPHTKSAPKSSESKYFFFT